MTISFFHKKTQIGDLTSVLDDYLTEDERELLISATCGECWDILFGEDEEELMNG